ncbi:MAG: hypothetical protein ACREGI_02960 [Candidatus Levyibacteriota bacterium]
MKYLEYYIYGFLDNFIKKIVHSIKNSKRKIYLTIIGVLVCAILYGVSFLPYLNLLFNLTFVWYGFIVYELLIFLNRPQIIIKLAILLFIFLIIPTILGFQLFIEQIGNIIFILILVAVIQYIKKVRREK